MVVNVERLVVNRESDLASEPNLQYWADRAIADGNIRAIVRQREQTIHVWCEGMPCPNAAQMTSAFSQAIYQNHDLPIAVSPVSRVVLYGRSRDPRSTIEQEPELGASPDWTVRLEIQAHQIQPTKASSPPPQTYNDLVQAIEQTLEGIGQSVENLKISIRDLNRSDEPQGGDATDKRLWILCESHYTPDPARLVRPIATRLRELNLKGFRDAVLVGQVSGETEPEWVLRIDLTPPEQIIRRWAQWGDVAAIAHRLEQRLTPIHLQVSAMLRDSTLHIVCSPEGEPETTTLPSPLKFPSRDEVLARIEPVLADLSPRGILGATVYGLDRPYEAAFPVPSAPQWVTWLDLPAKQYPSLEVASIEMARAGNLDAIAFLLDRLLNPDLHEKLATGGQHVEIRRQNDLLHIAVEAPILPDRDQTCAIVARLIEQIETTDLLGVRLYGRRSGQRQPDWHHSLEFRASVFPQTATIQRDTPDVSANPNSDASVDPSANSATDDAIHAATHPSNTTAPIFSTPFVTAQPGRTSASPLSGIRHLLCSSGLVTDRPSTPSFEPVRRARASFNTALIWGAVGVMLTVQTDWVTSELLERQVNREALLRGATTAQGNDTGNEMTNLRRDPAIAPPQGMDTPIDQIDQDVNGFDDRAFTAPPMTEPTTGETAIDPSRSQLATEIKADFPTLNSDQMDRQIALYAQYIEDFGVPDVLIVGSSRALRGIDPSALETALVKTGHPELRAFNLGINGATAQVVEVLLTQVLAADQLPKLVIWADGARAFNSGREDRTYQAIAQSPGYASIRDGFRPIASTAPALPSDLAPSFFDRFSQRYRDLNDQLTRGFSDHSATYAQREQLRENLRDFAIARLQPEKNSTTLADASATSSQDLGNAALHRNGFFAFADRFAPSDYYERYTHVPGSYDSDYDAFQLRGIQSISLTNIADVLRSREIKLVFINLPLTKTYLDETRRSYESAFSAYMLQASKTLDFAFRDFGQLWPEQNEYFSDPSHLNRYGAEAVAIRLAQSPMIPWETLADPSTKTAATPSP